MKYNTRKTNNDWRKGGRGFIAMIAVILLAAGTLAFSLATMSAAVSYADAVGQRELRIQAALNAKSCLDSVTLMAAKDYYLNGEVTLPEFDCTADVTNDFNNHLNVELAVVLAGVTSRASGDIYLPAL